ncbi:hypothetical protein LIER_22239 [Lithospermum erythrorhizon]|uniref:Uncharacterized protein n=1 Tax=Lithospermum erythrorhizon TaxID=34254 RepID=A0AAV3QXC8_LITER
MVAQKLLATTTTLTLFDYDQSTSPPSLLAGGPPQADSSTSSWSRNLAGITEKAKKNGNRNSESTSSGTVQKLLDKISWNQFLTGFRLAFRKLSLY